MPIGKTYFETFLKRGWKPNWNAHPVADDAPLEMVLIEPRNHRYLQPVLENMSCLVPNASLTIIHSQENAKIVHDIVYAGGENNVKTLSILPTNLTRETYSELLTSCELWTRFQAPKVLIFQLDSGLRFNNILRFMQYDYVGAPWNWLVANDPRICVGNGGFSLRSKQHMYDICSRFKYNATADTAEDVFFAKHLINDKNVCLPSKVDASKFSIEHISYHDPMAFHQAYDFHSLATVKLWMMHALAPTSFETCVQIEDAWIESKTGVIQREPDLLPWLRLGISTNGLLIDQGTKISSSARAEVSDEDKLLKLAFKKDGENHRISIPLDRKCIVMQPITI